MDAGCPKSCCNILDSGIGLIEPSRRGQASVSRIQADRHAIGPPDRDSGDQVRGSDGGSTENHPIDTEIERTVDVRFKSKATAQLNRYLSNFPNLAYRINIDRF